MNKARLRRRNTFLRGLAGVLPDFVIIGTQKGGTGTLYKLLLQHPAVMGAKTKEVTYFERHFQKGQLWYRAHFPTRSERSARAASAGKVLVGEASPDYIYVPTAATNAQQTVPKAKLLAVLRNPTDRAFSHYQHELRKKCEALSFEEALAQEDIRMLTAAEHLMRNPRDSYHFRHFSYKARGLYARQLKNWFDHFPREQFLVLRTEDFGTDPAGTVKQACDFLGIDSEPIKDFGRANVGGYAETMKPETRAQLVEYFRPHNAELEQLLGRKLDWDS
jgi:hypothetical protein